MFKKLREIAGSDKEDRICTDSMAAGGSQLSVNDANMDPGSSSQDPLSRDSANTMTADDSDSASVISSIIYPPSTEGVDLHTRFQRVLRLARGYKEKLKQAVSVTKRLEKERDQLVEALENNQAKVSRRIQELQEQCELDRRAKQDLETNYRLLLSEKDEFIQVLQLQVSLLRDGKDPPAETESKIKSTLEREAERQRSLELENHTLKAKVAELGNELTHTRHEFTDSRLMQSALETQVAHLKEQLSTLTSGRYMGASSAPSCDVTTCGICGESSESLRAELASIHKQLCTSKLECCRLQNELDYYKNLPFVDQSTVAQMTTEKAERQLALSPRSSITVPEGFISYPTEASVCTQESELAPQLTNASACTVELVSKSSYFQACNKPEALVSQLDGTERSLCTSINDVVEKERTLRSTMMRDFANIFKRLGPNVFISDLENMNNWSYGKMLEELVKFLNFAAEQIVEKNDSVFRLTNALEAAEQDCRDRVNSLICDHDSQLCNLQASLATAIDSRNELVQKLDASTKQVLDFQRESEEVRLQLIEAKRMLQDTQDLLSHHAADRDRLTEKCAKLESACKLLEDEKNSLLTRLSSAAAIETECNELRNKVSELTQAIDERKSTLDTEVAVLSAHLSDSNARLSRANSLIKRHHNLFNQIVDMRQQLVSIRLSLAQLKSDFQSALDNTSAWLPDLLQEFTIHLTATLPATGYGFVPTRTVLQTCPHFEPHEGGANLRCSKCAEIERIEHGCFSDHLASVSCQKLGEQHEFEPLHTDDISPSGRHVVVLDMESQTVASSTDKESLCAALQDEVSRWDDRTQGFIKKLRSEQETRFSNLSALLLTFAGRLSIAEQQLNSAKFNAEFVRDLQTQVNDLQSSLTSSEHRNHQLNSDLSHLLTQVSELTDVRIRSQHDMSMLSQRWYKSLLLSLQSMVECASGLMTCMPPHHKGPLIDELTLVKEGISSFSSVVSSDPPGSMSFLDDFERLQQTLVDFLTRVCDAMAQSHVDFSAEVVKTSSALLESKKQVTSLQQENEDLETELLRARSGLDNDNAPLQIEEPSVVATREQQQNSTESPTPNQLGLCSLSKVEQEYADRVMSLELQLQEFKELCEAKNSMIEVNEDEIKRIKAESSNLNKLYADAQQRLSAMQQEHADLQSRLLESQSGRVTMERQFECQLADVRSAASSREKQLRQQLKDTRNRLKQLLHDSECMRKSTVSVSTHAASPPTQTQGTEMGFDLMCDECERMQRTIGDLRRQLDELASNHTAQCTEPSPSAKQSNTHTVDEPAEDYQLLAESLKAEHAMHVQEMQRDFEQQLRSKESDLRTCFEKELDRLRGDEARRHQAAMENVQSQLNSLRSENEDLHSQVSHLQSELMVVSSTRGEESSALQADVSDLRSQVSDLQAKLEQATRSHQHPNKSQPSSGILTIHSEDASADPSSTQQITRTQIQTTALPRDYTDVAPSSDLVRQLRAEILRADSIDSLHPSVRSSHYSNQVFMQDYEALHLHNADLQNQLHQLAAEFEALRSRCPTCNGSRDPDSSIRSYFTTTYSPSNCSVGFPLHESVEYEYLKNVLFEYMMGRETWTLSKVLCSIMQFNPEQTKRILQHEGSKSRTWTLQTRIE
ncbi:unnamed protein product [Dicrocoelium dendriticum]|nr:unnamed protein product [Dicrocoelium dendriticum]